MSLLNQAIHPLGLKFEEKGMTAEHPVRCLCHESRINHAIRLHYHDSFEINLIRGISGEVRLEGKSLKLEETNLIFLPPGLLHSYSTQGSSSPDGLFKVWHLKPENFIYLNTGALRQTMGQLEGSIVLNEVSEGIGDILEILEKGDALQQNAAFLRLFTLLTRHRPYAGIKGMGDDFLHRVIAFLEENYHRPLTLTETAEQMNLSKYHFSRKFHQRANSSFSAYLNTLRLEKSLERLHRGLKVEDAAYDSGFEDPSYYISKFRELYGETPGQYRKALGL